MMEPNPGKGRGLSILLVIFLGVTQIVWGQQKAPENWPQTIDMGSFKVNAPAGGGWKMTVDKDKRYVAFKKFQAGLLRQVAGAIQGTTINIDEITIPPESWGLSEERLIAEIEDEILDAERGASGKLSGIQKQQTEREGKKYYILVFTRQDADPEILPWTQIAYLYLPSQYKRSHVLYRFCYGLAGKLEKLTQVSFFSVVDSFQLIDSLASIAGDSGELLRAAASGEKQTIVGLIDKGVDINATAPQGTAMTLGASFGRLDTIDLLLEKGADINKPDQELGAPPIIWAIMSGESELADHLMGRGAEINARTKAGYSALMYAVAARQEGLARKLIEKGADVRARNATGETPLYFSAATGQIVLAVQLIESGADINAQTDYGTTPLMRALWRSHFDVANLLIDKGAELNKQDADGKTALIVAITQENIALVKALVERGADINIQLKDRGWTPLITAVAIGNLEASRYLIGKGAKINIKSKDGLTALKLAKARHYDDLVDLLKQAGAK